MATGKRIPSARSTGARRRSWLRVAAVLAVGAIALGWLYREPLTGYSSTAAAFGARTACSCRHLAGRSLADCKKDFEPGMEVVFLSEDEEAKSVTGRVPLLARDTARWREGYGCVLDPWEE